MKPHVLIAESDRRIADELKGFLASRGYRVDVAGGGLDALERMRGRLPQFLVMSTELPWGGCDGVLDLMRTGSDVPLVPVVLTGANGNVRGRAVFFGSPVVRRLPNPVSPLDLFNVLEGMSPDEFAG